MSEHFLNNRKKYTCNLENIGSYKKTDFQLGLVYVTHVPKTLTSHPTDRFYLKHY